MKLYLVALPAAFLPIACQTPADPPSLLPRAIERQPTSAAPAAAPAVLRPADAALVAQLARLVADANAGDADFTAIARTDGAALAAGKRATQGSEAWISAETARSALIAARQKSADALADIDSLAIMRAEQASRDPTTTGLSEILSSQAQISAIVDRQTARLAALSR